MFECNISYQEVMDIKRELELLIEDLKEELAAARSVASIFWLEIEELERDNKDLRKEIEQLKCDIANGSRF